MGIDLKTLGERLDRARKNCGYTQQQAADAVGLPRTAIVHIEAGNRSINTVELAALAEFYKVPVAYFFEQSTPEQPSALVALCRVSTEFASDPAVNQEISRYVDICGEGMSLLEILGRKAVRSAPTYDLPETSNYAEAIQQGQQVADQERRRMGLGDAPITDMRELIVMQGIWAAGAKLPNEISGLFLQHPSIGTVILVNHEHVRARKRFSYAHEYAHAILDHKRIATVTSKSNATEFIEKRANAFAAAFLMPKGGIDALLRSLDKGGGSRTEFLVYDVANESAIEGTQRSLASQQTITFRDVMAVAHYFRASYQAAAYRLGELGFVNRAAVTALLQQEDQANMLLKLIGVLADLQGTDQTNTEHELVGQVVPLAIEAFRREEISKGRIRDLSKKLNCRELLSLADAA